MQTTANKPIIGIPLGMKDSTFSRHPHYAMEALYFEAVSLCGGIPQALTYQAEHFDHYMANVDGVLIPGGSFASPTHWYEEEVPTLPEASAWSDFYLKVTEHCLSHKKPVLGICAGMQFLACVAGGQMTVDIQQKITTKIDHLNGAPKEENAHHVTLLKGSKLHQITGLETFAVNSAHREAVTQLGTNTTASAHCTEDGCIEAIEVEDHPFAIGVQWHPEFFTKDQNSPHYQLIKAFINETKHNK